MYIVKKKILKYSGKYSPKIIWEMLIILIKTYTNTHRNFFATTRPYLNQSGVVTKSGKLIDCPIVFLPLIKVILYRFRILTLNNSLVMEKLTINFYHTN